MPGGYIPPVGLKNRECSLRVLTSLSREDYPFTDGYGSQRSIIGLQVTVCGMEDYWYQIGDGLSVCG